MKSFSYNPKTGRYEFRHVDIISKPELKVLKLIKEKQFISHTDVENLFRNCGNERFQESHNIIFHLTHLDLIEYKIKYRMCLKYNTKDYKKSKYVEVDGYFLTENGKAFLSAIFPEPKKKNVRS